MTLSDLQQLAQSGAVIVVNIQTLNDYSQHVTIDTVRTAAPLMTLREAERDRNRVNQDEWNNAGYL